MQTAEIQCLCGAVKIRLSGEPTSQFYCHCDDCRAVSGGAYVPVAVFPAHAVAVLQGEMTPFTLKSLPRLHCASCGTQVMAELPGMEARAIKANLLPKGRFKPQFHIQCKYALLPVHDELPHYTACPAVFGGTDERVVW